LEKASQSKKREKEKEQGDIRTTRKEHHFVFRGYDMQKYTENQKKSGKDGVENVGGSPDRDSIRKGGR